jgi:glycosyltransferase involved in cell wall biosynthesis
MKIGHFIDSLDPGGAETLVVELCRNLPRFDISVEIYHFGNSWLAEMCRKHGIISFVVPGYNYYNSFKTLPIFAYYFHRFLKDRSIDILHSHLFGSIIGASFVANRFGIPHIGTLHDLYTLQERKGRIRLLQLSAILGTQLITVSPTIETYLRKSGLFPRKSIQTILNGVDLDKFKKPNTNHETSTDLSNKKEIVFVSVGRLVELKGYDVLIKAIGLVESSLQWRLIIAGDGPMKQKIGMQIKEQHMDDKITLLGERDDIASLLAQSDCFVLPSHSEGLSCSIIEAMACGLPIIATRVGGNPILVKDGESGCLVSPNDPVDLAHALTILAQDKTKREEFGRKSLAYAREKLSLDSMLASYINHYKEIEKRISLSIL